MKTINRYKNLPPIREEEKINQYFSDELNDGFCDYNKNEYLFGNDFEDYENDFDIEYFDIIKRSDNIIMETKNLIDAIGYKEPEEEFSIFTNPEKTRKDFISKEEQKQINDDFVMALKLQEEFNKEYKEYLSRY